jgi:DNA mismatch repair ATPase MutS
MELLLNIGELDALQSIASFREGLPFYTEPVFAAPSVMLELVDGCHPVLDEAIPNSISVEKNNVVITGANMSGKSTFLRTVAVNVLMAQSVYTCYAASYRAPFFVILSCMRVSDVLSESKSLYFAEAEQLLAMVKAADGNTPALCVIDEPLSGTNGPERVSASLEILRYLACHRALVVVATHDMDVALGLLDEYQAYHFNDPFLGANEAGKYRIRAGLDYDSNALLLLDKLGFCPALGDAARARLEKIRQTLGSQVQQHYET